MSIHIHNFTLIIYYEVDRKTNKNYESRQGKGKKIKSLPVVLLATAKQQTYIVELTNLVPLERKKIKIKCLQDFV